LSSLLSLTAFKFFLFYNTVLYNKSGNFPNRIAEESHKGLLFFY
jgi:hypothetical protein